MDSSEKNERLWTRLTNTQHAYIMAAVDTFKAAIIKIRDILRGPGVNITGMDSMRHICMYLLSRYVTRERAASLGIPDEFSWESVYTLISVDPSDDQAALDRFRYQREESLVTYFDRLFATEKFSFDMFCPLKHKEILFILNDVNIDAVDCHMDMLGWVYEQHLKTGSSSASRDLGQYFTDRALCQYMTALCAPRFKAPGVPETVCDPTMGTGGFLTSYVKYYATTYPDTPIDWSVHHTALHGYDTDTRVASVAMMNMYMELHGHRAENLRWHDSLYGDVGQPGFDVILANMPFGIKGIDYNKCCDRVQALRMKSSVSEPLFLQLMMTSLNPGGRCAVVIPNGMLTNQSSLYVNLRKYLVNHLELRRVIQIRGRCFMNTLIKAAVLFFENTGRPTTQIEFWEATKDDTGRGYMDEHVLTLPRNELDAFNTFDPRNYMDTRTAPNSAFPTIKLNDICQMEAGRPISEKKNAGTLYPVYGSGRESYRTDKYNREGITCKIARGAANECTLVMIITGPYWLTNTALTITSVDESRLLNPYLWYLLLLDKPYLATLTSGSCQPHLDVPRFLDVEYPLPPIDVQQAFVATLDAIKATWTDAFEVLAKFSPRITELLLAFPDGSTLIPIANMLERIQNMDKTIQVLETAMKETVRGLQYRGYSVHQLDQLFTVIVGRSPSRAVKENYEGGTNVWVKAGELLKNVIYDSAEHITDAGVADEKIKRVSAGSILMCIIQSIGKIAIAGVDLYTNNAVAAFNTLNPRRALNRYLYYYLSAYDFTDAGRGSIAKGSMCRSRVCQLPVILPPLDVQTDLVTRLDRMQDQIDQLKAMQTDMERNARYMLENYLGPPAQAE